MKHEPARTCGDAGGRRSDGSPCGTYLNLSPTNGLCLWHDPERRERFREISAAGGRAAAKARREKRAADPDDVPPPPRTLDDACRWASWAIHAVAVGRIHQRTGHEIGYLVNAFKAAIEKRDLLREIEDLRAQLDDAKGHGRPRAVK